MHPRHAILSLISKFKVNIHSRQNGLFEVKANGYNYFETIKSRLDKSLLFTAPAS